MTVILGPWKLGVGWTVPRAHALRVLALCPEHGVRSGNRTQEFPDGRYGGIVHSLVLGWLRSEGYARSVDYGGWGGTRRYELTQKGLDLVASLGGVS